ncbi:MAG TPA: divalent-cation tolerance protein CutA [Thermoanaerobaculia bacterium]|nr:divalent-cation tolerance protein CutA [Thermoanaerobaculia bacterium]
MTPLLVLTTVGADFDAVSFARSLVEARLAACVNILPAVESIYRWENRVTQDGEKLLLIKTTAERLPELRAALLERHPYDLPELVVIRPEQVEERYAAWIAESTTAPTAAR